MARELTKGPIIEGQKVAIIDAKNCVVCRTVVSVDRRGENTRYEIDN